MKAAYSGAGTVYGKNKFMLIIKLDSQFTVFHVLVSKLIIDMYEDYQMVSNYSPT